MNNKINIKFKNKNKNKIFILYDKYFFMIF